MNSPEILQTIIALTALAMMLLGMSWLKKYLWSMILK